MVISRTRSARQARWLRGMACFVMGTSSLSICETGACFIHLRGSNKYASLPSSRDIVEANIKKSGRHDGSRTKPKAGQVARIRIDVSRESEPRMLRDR